ncbi:hypothetical protein XENORESO_021130 [Xenotaenia resolanae]|uniref:Uncharacterized protein n=1 Tax=Xenotaenia resolanae TaxID=208358 RepID=A0ABV0W602_9TELE
MHRFGKNESVPQSGRLRKAWSDKKNHARTIKPVPSTDSELPSGKIHSGQLLRGMHKIYVRTQGEEEDKEVISPKGPKEQKDCTFMAAQINSTRTTKLQLVLNWIKC